MGRSIVSLIVMLVAFGVLAAIFVVLDEAAGVRIHAPLFAATAATATPAATQVATTATPSGVSTTPSPGAATTTAPGTATTTSGAGTTVTPGSAATVTAGAPATTQAPATPTATATAAPPTQTVTPLPTPPGGITPPRYGALPNYTNNTSFSPAMLQTLDERIIALTNQERARHNLAPLTESESLDIIAASRSQDMIQRHYFDHYDPTGPVDAQGHHAAAVQELLLRNNISYAEVGENLIGNTGFPLDNNTPQQVVTAWMHHPEHRANILHAAYTTIGVGMAAENEQNTLRVVITQIFIR